MAMKSNVAETAFIVFKFRRKPKEMLGMFSETLLQLNRVELQLKNDKTAELQKRIERLEGRR